MPRSSVAQRPSLGNAPWYGSDLLPQLQNTLSLLADLDLRHQAELEQLQAWPGPEDIKERFEVQLDERYRREREPLAQQLADLHRLVLEVMTLQDICSTT